jgi:hypothetical protein
MFTFSSAAVAQRMVLAAGGPSGLPDAPGEITMETQATGARPEDTSAGSISGTVIDINGGLVAGAKITLMEIVAGTQPAVERVVTSDTAGNFVFNNVGAGRFRFTIVSPGLETFVSAEIALKPGERRIVPQVALPIASAATEVQVVVTQTELAQEQIHEEEKQRVLGVLPNFYTSYLWNAAPLTKGQKFGLALRSISDPTAFLGAAVVAGVEQEQNTYRGYGQGAQGYFKRFGAAYADDTVGRVIGSAVLPALLKQDPRYFYKGSGTKKSRAWYAIEMAVVKRDDDGRLGPNYSHIGGALAAGAIANAYHPAGDRGVGLTFSNAALETAGNAANNLIREFLLRRVTPNVPGYANGKP